MKKHLLKITFIAILSFLANATMANNRQVFVTDSTFTPDTLIVTVGDTITWILQTGATPMHSVTSSSKPVGADSLKGELVTSSSAYDYIVMVAGTYTYYDKYNPGMTGSFIATTGTGIKSTPRFETKAFPNPIKSNSLLKVTNPGFKPSGFVIYDVIGKPVMRTTALEVHENGNIEINTGNLTKGLYFMVLYNEEQEAQVRLVKE
jgi:plastocyanin